MGFFQWLNSEPANLREWVIAYIYRVDAGLFEIEKDYAKKFKKTAAKKIMLDKGYNQLQGKMTMLMSLASDFSMKFYPDTFGTRITLRMKQRGGKWVMPKQ